MATDSTKKGATVYYPNVIGQSDPGKTTSWAILVEGRNDYNCGAMALNTLIKYGARILSQTGYSNEKYGTYTLTIECDLAGVSATLDDIVIQLRKLRHVTSVESISLKNQMFDGLLFPLVLMDSHRVVAVSASFMFEIQENLRTLADKKSLFEAGRQYGGDVVNRLKQKLEAGEEGKLSGRKSADKKVIQENIQRFMKAAGWGRITWEGDDSLERVFIYDPPTPRSKESGGAGNLFLQGLISGLTESLRGKRYAVVEDHFDAQRRLLTIGLTEESLAVQMEGQNQFKNEVPVEEQSATALNEVERLITSVQEITTGKPQEKKEEMYNVITIPVVEESGNKFHFTMTRKNQPPAAPKNDAEKSQTTPVPIQKESKVSVARDSPKEKVDVIPRESEITRVEKESEISTRNETPEEKMEDMAIALQLAQHSRFESVGDERVKVEKSEQKNESPPEKSAASVTQERIPPSSASPKAPDAPKEDSIIEIKDDKEAGKDKEVVMEKSRSEGEKEYPQKTPQVTNKNKKKPDQPETEYDDFSPRSFDDTEFEDPWA